MRTWTSTEHTYESRSSSIRLKSTEARHSSRDVLERVGAAFEEELWTSEVGANIRGWLSRWGVGDETLRAYGVGYAPGKPSWLLGELGAWGFDEADLVSAGVASRSSRGAAHGWFHARVMFPIRSHDGEMIGFAGLATHLGPSWPLWLTSPGEGPFDPGIAMFAVDRARATIEATGRALIVRDCVEAMILQQAGRMETVAVVQSPITHRHSQLLAEMMGAPAVHLSRRDGRLGVVASASREAVGDEAFASRSTPNGFVLIHSHRKAVPPQRATQAIPADPSRLRVRSTTRLLALLLGGLIGAGVPIGLLFLAGIGESDSPSSALNVTIVGLAVFYVAIALAVARFSARTDAGSGERRMRLPWVRGSGEVQPSGWTFHALEETVVGAALVSAIFCVIFLVTLGDFFG